MGRVDSDRGTLCHKRALEVVMDCVGNDGVLDGGRGGVNGRSDCTGVLTPQSYTNRGTGKNMTSKKSKVEGTFRGFVNSDTIHVPEGGIPRESRDDNGITVSNFDIKLKLRNK